MHPTTKVTIGAILFIIFVLIFQEYIIPFLVGMWVVYYFKFIKDRKCHNL